VVVAVSRDGAWRFSTMSGRLAVRERVSHGLEDTVVEESRDVTGMDVVAGIETVRERVLGVVDLVSDHEP
jgi:hypothetical protein